MVAIVYVRVSSEDKAKRGYSIPDQTDKGEQRARELGATQVIVIVDDGITGEVLQRPGLEKARELIKAGGISLFVTLDPDRFARKLMFQLILTDEFERAGVRLEFVNYEWRDTPDGRLFYSFRGAIAEYEKEKTRLRTMSGKLRKAKDGLVTHAPQTFGYRYKDSHLEIEPKEAALARQIYEWYRDGDGFKAITDRLNEMGFLSPKGKVWQRGTVKRILVNPTYTGKLHLNKHDTAGSRANRYLPKEQRRPRKIRPPEEWVEVPVPIIIDEVLFRAVQKRNEQARRLHSGHAIEFYLLSGLITCGVCGHTMHGNRTTARAGKHHRYYVCTAKSPGLPGVERCPNPHHQAGEIEEEVLGALENWLSDISLWLEKIESQAQKPTAPSNIDHLEKELQSVKEQQGRLLDVVQRGMVELSDVAERMEKLKNQEMKLKQALAEVKRLPETPLPTAKELEALAQKNRLMLAGNLQKKQAAVRHLIKEVLVTPETIEIIPREAV